MDNCSDERCKKKAKQQAEDLQPHPHHDYGGFASLPTDVLISILCRSPASDHESLSDTCKAFRATIDSDAYKGERASSGWAEVSTHLLSGEELYDEHFPNGPEDVSLSDGDVEENATEEQRANALQFKKAEKKNEEMLDFGYYSELGQLDQEYGYRDITIYVRVDGNRCGSISLVLLPRGTDYPFHDATDAHSAEMQSVGWTLCDSAGRLKVRSIKDAELIPGEAGKGGFLHIKTVRISEAYHPMDCTNIVTEAVRLALSDPKLEGKWTLATAISDYQVYMTKEGMECQRKSRSGRANDMEKERAKQRFWECALLDTKTLLRVGFRQIPETVSEKQNPYWLFALPSFLKDPIQSFEEVDRAPLIEPPDLPPKPVGVDDEILEVVKQKSNSMRQIQDMVDSINFQLEKEMQTHSEELPGLEEQIAETRTLIDAGKPAHLSDEIWGEIVAQFERLEETKTSYRATFEANIQSRRDKVRDIIDTTIPGVVEEFKAQVTALVRKGGSIRKSHAIHCCSRLRITQFIDFLVDMVPPEERAQALCSLDACGITPLHCVVLGTPEVRDRDKYIDFVERLLGMGADTNVKSARGVTPIGQYRLTMSNKFDFRNVFGMRSGDEPAGWRPFHRKMEGLLRPSQGETDADVEAKCAVLDNDVDPDESSDDDNEEEDDWMDDDDEDEDENEDDVMMEVDEENEDSNDRGDA
mmetsp:Transcript_21223/g.30375  ORF Transcript_21223/g.30375 Transcript_21223/m.30375 type:complete len:699 (+) Transcript_21223:37-2133(+)